MNLVKQLREAAEKRAEDRRVAEYGPGGGNPNATANQHIEWIAAERISELEGVIEKAIEDVNWMTNEGKLLNRNVFDYLDQAVAGLRI